MHVGHDIVTIAGNRAGTMLVQVTIPALLGARRKSGRVQWWAVVTKAQICVILICKSESSRTSYICYQHLYMYMYMKVILKKLHIIPPCWEKVRVWL